MQSPKQYVPGSKRLFNQPFLERLTRTPFWLPVILFYLISVFSVYYTVKNYNESIFVYLLIFPLGIIFFTLVEYILHRFVFHFNAVTEKEKKLQYTIHGVHHEFPRDKDRLVMPVPLSIFLSAIFFGIYFLIMGSWGILFFAGFAAGYSTYLMIHYAVHKLRPPRNILRYLWKHHSLHHFKGDHFAFAVSMPFWDYVFNTLPSNTKSR
jgi:4-hydroxysphinganine ceramide fatty acyl 2-hydroxylase